MDDTQVKKQLLLQDEQVFSSVVNTYSKLLWSIASGIIYPNGSIEDIEECVSDAFCELWKQPDKYNPERGSIKSYLCIIAKNRAIDIVRKNAKTNTISFEESKKELAYEDKFEAEDYSALYDAISSIKEPTKEILIRRYFNDEKPKEIAAKMKIPKKEVENRLYRSKQKIKSFLSKKQEVL